MRQEHRDALIDLMEAVEDIPGPALAEGLKWDWESFPEFLDALERMPRTIDVARADPAPPAARLRDGRPRASTASPRPPDDIAEMRRLTEEAVRAGAFGFTTSRTNAHKTNAGELVPGHFAEKDELSGIGQALGAAGTGAFGMNSDFDDEAAEFAWMTRLSKETGRPVWFLLTDRTDRPGALEAADGRRACGARRGRAVTAQVAGRPVGVILGIATSFNPFSIRPSYRRARRAAAARAAARGCATRRCAGSSSPRSRRSASSPGCRRRVQDMVGPLGPHVRDGRRRPITSRRRRRASPRSPRAATARPQEVAYDYLTEGLDQFPVLPGHRLRRRRPRARSARC